MLCHEICCGKHMTSQFTAKDQIIITQPSFPGKSWEFTNHNPIIDISIIALVSFLRFFSPCFPVVFHRRFPAKRDPDPSDHHKPGQGQGHPNHLDDDRICEWKIRSTHMLHVWNIYLHDWVIMVVNVGKYSIHGAHGEWNMQGYHF